MFIAKVIGNVVATQKNAKFLGMKLLLIQPYISRDGKLQISRKYISIGSPTWSQVVDDTVQVRFHLVQ